MKDIYTELKKDNREIRALLRQLVSLNKNDEYRLLLIAETRNALVAKCRTQEAVFYNALLSRGSAAARVCARGLGQHVELESALWLLQAVERVGANWKPMARKLSELAEKYFTEEERVIFPMAQKIFSSQEAKKMGRAYLDARPELEQSGELRATLAVIASVVSPRLNRFVSR